MPKSKRSGRTAARWLVMTASAACLAITITMLTAAPSFAVVIHSLGGVSMQEACNTQYRNQDLTAVATNRNSAYSWQCQRPGVSRGISVAAECVTQYGSGAVAAVANPDNAFSWYCHWSIGNTTTSNLGDPGQCTWWALNEFYTYSGSYPYITGNADNYATSAASNGWTVTATPRVDSIAVFPPGVNGADGTYGHVAWVTGVSGSEITISEMNGTAGPYNVDTRTLTPASSVRFILAP